MPDLPADLLSRIAQATHRGEHLYLDEPLLVLPLVADPPASSLSWLDSHEPGLLEELWDLLRGLEGLRHRWQYMFFDSTPSAVIGTLVLSPEAAYRELDGQWETQALSAATPLRLEYYIYSAAPWVRARYDGGPWVANRLQIGRWPAHGVLVREPADERRLVQLLRAWYERRLPLRETYRGERALLLRTNMSYEELQDFKQRYGVQLYR